MTSLELVNPRSFIIRKIVKRDNSLSINLPRDYVRRNKISDSDYMKIYEDQNNNLIFQKLGDQ